MRRNSTSKTTKRPGLEPVVTKSLLFIFDLVALTLKLPNKKDFSTSEKAHINKTAISKFFYYDLSGKAADVFPYKIRGIPCVHALCQDLRG